MGLLAAHFTPAKKQGGGGAVGGVDQGELRMCSFSEFTVFPPVVVQVNLLYPRQFQSLCSSAAAAVPPAAVTGGFILETYSRAQPAA